MPNTPDQATRELDFLRTFENMDITIRRAQLIGKIESRAQDTERADLEEITLIQQELKEYREQLRDLQQGPDDGDHVVYVA